MGTESSLVLDASVGVKLFLPESDSAMARAVFGMLLSPEGTEGMVPDLFFPECAHALGKGILRYGLPPDLVARALGTLCSGGLESVATRSLVLPAMAISRDEGTSLYDAVYVALSDRTGAPLVTADRPLFDRLAGTRHRVRWLGEFAAGAAEETLPGA